MQIVLVYAVYAGAFWFFLRQRTLKTAFRRFSCGAFCLSQGLGRHESTFPQSVPGLGTKSGSHDQSGRRDIFNQTTLFLDLYPLFFVAYTNTSCIHQAQTPMYKGLSGVSVCSVCKKLIFFDALLAIVHKNDPPAARTHRRHGETTIYGHSALIL